MSLLFSFMVSAASTASATAFPKPSPTDENAARDSALSFSSPVLSIPKSTPERALPRPKSLSTQVPSSLEPASLMKFCTDSTRVFFSFTPMYPIHVITPSKIPDTMSGIFTKISFIVVAAMVPMFLKRTVTIVLRLSQEKVVLITSPMYRNVSFAVSPMNVNQLPILPNTLARSVLTSSIL